MKRLERKRILEDDETVGPPMKKAKRGKQLGMAHLTVLSIVYGASDLPPRATSDAFYDGGLCELTHC